MKTTENPPNPARFRRSAEHSSCQRFSFQHFSFTKSPFSPATPISPLSSLSRGYDRQAGPTQWLFQGPPAESKFLAIQYVKTLRRSSISGTTKKALAIHCARDIAPAGPDYTTGWGVFQTAPMVELLRDDNDAKGHQHVCEMVIKGAAPVSFIVQVVNNVPPPPAPGEPQPVLGPQDPLKVTIAWADPSDEGEDSMAIYGSIDNDAIKLVNNFQFTIRKLPDIDGNGELGPYLEPWLLNPENPSEPAGTGLNYADNVNQIVVPYDPGLYLIEITGLQNVNVQQSLSMIISGNKPYTEESIADLKRVQDYLKENEPSVEGTFPPFTVNGGFMEANGNSYVPMWWVDPFTTHTIQRSPDMINWEDGDPFEGSGTFWYEETLGGGLIKQFFRMKSEEKSHYQPGSR